MLSLFSEKPKDKRKTKYNRLSFAEKDQVINSFDEDEGSAKCQISSIRMQCKSNFDKKQVIQANKKCLQEQDRDLHWTKLSGVEESNLEKQLYRWFL